MAYPMAMITLLLLTYLISPLQAAEDPELACTLADDECWDTLREPDESEVPQMRLMASDPAPVVMRLPCRLQWAAVTSCLLTEASGQARRVPCTPEAYEVYVRQPPAAFPSTPTVRLPHPTTNTSCEAMGLEAGQSYVVAVRTTGVNEPFNAPEQPSDLSNDLEVSIPQASDVMPPAPAVLSVTAQ